MVEEEKFDSRVFFSPNPIWKRIEMTYVEI